MTVIRQLQIKLLLAENYRDMTQNRRAQTAIREIKMKRATRMQASNVPARARRGHWLRLAQNPCDSLLREHPNPS